MYCRMMEEAIRRVIMGHIIFHTLIKGLLKQDLLLRTQQQHQEVRQHQQEQA